MLIALSLLLIALSIVLYRDRDFWFPDTQEADDQEVTDPPANGQPAQAIPPVIRREQETPKRPPSKRRTRDSIPERTLAESQPVGQSSIGQSPDGQSPDGQSSNDLPFATVSQRTALPALEVEVVAGDMHKQIRPGSNSVHVDLQPGSQGQPAVDAPVAAAANSAPITPSDASERVEMSADTADIVSRPVSPGYPLLARQMKVQGSVILQALIGRDGMIQNLRVVSGPPILASAAQEAVKQWHFKPHYQGAEAVETKANITVNFTISTN
jgi:TonB family protein